MGHISHAGEDDREYRPVCKGGYEVWLYGRRLGVAQKIKTGRWLAIRENAIVAAVRWTRYEAADALEADLGIRYSA